jgi:putative transcription factor
MNHQDWKPVVLRKKTEHKTKRSVGNKKFHKLDSDDPDAPKKISLSAGKQIQQARCDKKLSQKQLAQLLNVKAQLITDYESGKAIPSRSVLNKLNRALGIKIR